MQALPLLSLWHHSCTAFWGIWIAQYFKFWLFCIQKSVKYPAVSQYPLDAYDSLVDLQVNKSNPLQTFLQVVTISGCAKPCLSIVSYVTNELFNKCFLSQPFSGFSYHILYYMKPFWLCLTITSSISEKNTAKIVTKLQIFKLRQITLTC